MITSFCLLFTLWSGTAKCADSTVTDTTTVMVTDSVGKPISAVLDSMFRTLDPTGINTGFLGDRAFSFVNHALFNGTLHDSNYAAYRHMAPLYGFMLTSCVDSTYDFAFDSMQGYTNTLEAYRDSGYIALSMMAGHYNSFKDSAAADSLIYLQNGQLHETAGQPNPYNTNDLLAAAPLRASGIMPSETFRLPKELILGSRAGSISEIYVDFGDSSGYQLVQTGTDYQVTYQDTGQKTLITKVVFANGDTLMTHAHFNVNNANSAIYNANSDDQFTIAAGNNHSGALVEIGYGDCNTDQELKRPLIVVEGFDPISLLSKTN